MTLSDLYSQLIAVFVEWEGILKDPQYVRTNTSLTWSNAEITLLPEQLTRADTIELSRRRQFTFRVSEDDSVIQISYRFNNGRVVEARLAFYEVGIQQYDYEAANVQPLQEADTTTLARWVRFDYRETGLGRVLHTDSHFHVSGLPGTRFAVAGVPTPKQFIEFVISHFYPETYGLIRLSDDGDYDGVIDRINAHHMDCGCEPADLYARIAHFRVPVTHQG